MLGNVLDGVIKGMKIIKVDPAASQAVNHPLGILESHGPAYAVEAFNHGIFLSQLSGQGADCLGIAPVVGNILVIDPFQGLSQLFMGRIPPWNVAVALGAVAHGRDFRRIGKAVIPAPLPYLFVVAGAEQGVGSFIQIVPHLPGIFHLYRHVLEPDQEPDQFL